MAIQNHIHGVGYFSLDDWMAEAEWDLVVSAPDDLVAVDRLQRVAGWVEAQCQQLDQRIDFGQHVADIGGTARDVRLHLAAEHNHPTSGYTYSQLAQDHADMHLGG